jgi:hypothetical protein
MAENAPSELRDFLGRGKEYSLRIPLSFEGETALSLTDFGSPYTWHPQGQCHLNKKNLPKGGAFKSETSVPELFAVEGMEGAFDHAWIKAQTPGR